MEDQKEPVIIWDVMFEKQESTLYIIYVLSIEAVLLNYCSLMR